MTIRIRKPSKPHPTILGVSAGNGVMLFPFKDYLIGNVEVRSDYYVRSKPIQWDINFTQPMWDKLPELGASPLAIIGHPKCGSSSMLALSRGKKNTSHKGEKSLELFLSALKKYSPTTFLLENLPKLLDSYSLEDFQEMLPEYRLFSWQGSVSQFGNSQITRERLLILGARKDRLSKLQFHKLCKIPRKNATQTTYGLLKKLPKNGSYTEPLDEVITLYSGFKIKLSEMKDFWLNNPELKHYPIKDGPMNTAPGVYINRSHEFPLTARKTNRQFNPWGEQMSPRELARIQGIPDNFLLWDLKDKTSLNKGRVTVANTPPYEIGEWFLSRLRSIWLL
jgi:site-specific DNA-cytosine methylase